MNQILHKRHIPPQKNEPPKAHARARSLSPPLFPPPPYTPTEMTCSNGWQINAYFYFILECCWEGFSTSLTDACECFFGFCCYWCPSCCTKFCDADWNSWKERRFSMIGTAKKKIKYMSPSSRQAFWCVPSYKYSVWKNNSVWIFLPIRAICLFFCCCLIVFLCIFTNIWFQPWFVVFFSHIKLRNGILMTSCFCSQASN